MSEIKKSKFARLTPAEWEQIVTLWELGMVTLPELSRRYPITEEGLRQGLKKRGAKKGSRSHEVGDAIVEATKADAQKRLEKIAETKERYLDYTDIISKLTMKEVSEAVKGRVPLGTKKENITALQKAANTLARMRAEAYDLLGLNDENANDEELPELAITEYTPEELENIRRGFEVVEDDDLDDEIGEFEIDLPDFDETPDEESGGQ